MKGFVDEFKAFAMKGNVIDLAVAVVIGAAFGKIVSALVDSIIMPLVGVLLGGISFSELSTTIGEATIAYGAFLQAVVDFLIIAVVIFVVIKAINKTKDVVDGPEDEGDAKPAEPPEDITLLREIRDSLRR